MSLTGNPQVIFLDETTTGLDPQNRIAMWDMVKGLAADGTTVFLTTQYLDEAEYLADTIAILHGGKIIAEGTPLDLKEIMPQRGAKLTFSSEKKAAEAMRLLHDNNIKVEDIEQNLPTLEDVFLTLINEKGGSGHVV
jgi:ABC-2 type transport system ATP-binding protein